MKLRSTTLRSTGYRSSLTRKFGYPVFGIALILLLSSCGAANPDIRPTDSKLRDGISLLLKEIEINHPGNHPWEKAAVNIQLAKKLPVGLSTPAGWKLSWPSASAQELPYVYVPWNLLGTYPNHFSNENSSYSVKAPIPDSVVQDLSRQQFGNDIYFAAIVDAGYSQVDKRWIIFTSVPFLPVTDNAYGWATVVNGRWKIVDFGTALVGCGKVPAAVQSEFGFSCSQ